MASKVISVDISEVMNAFSDIEKKFTPNDYSAITMLLETAAKKMEAWAKLNRPWTDRTGRARSGLLGYAYWENKEVVAAVISHSVDYGVFLELAHERRFAILEQAIEEHKEEILSSVQKVLKGILK